MKKLIFTPIFSLLCMILSAQAPDPKLPAGSLYVQANPLISHAVPLPGSIEASAMPFYPSAQDEKEYRRNTVYFELFGTGIFYSVNYERRISPHVSLRAGFTSWSLHGGLFTILGIEKLSMTAFPVMVNYLTGPMKSSHLEIGAGLMPSFFSGKALFTGSEGANNQSLLVGTASIGYRYQPPDGGFFFRIALTPLLGQIVGYTGGLSFGLTF
jgi:hypothetical protein